MIKKDRKKPLKLRKLEVLLRRVAEDHPARHKIEQDYAKSLAGYRGEKAIDFYLKEIDESSITLHDIRLPYEDAFFQMDTLILSPKFIVILELKNIAGTVLFDQNFQQLVRTINGREEAFPDPVLQIGRLKRLLTIWLANLKFPSAPIETLIAVANSSTVIKASHNLEIKNKVIHAQGFPAKMEVYEKQHKNEKFSGNELRKMARLLIKFNQPYNPDILNPYGLQQTDILTGIFCPNCSLPAMERRDRAWICPRCYYKSRNAHHAALQDFVLLFGSQITNREVRSFLNLSSISIAGKLLASMDLNSTGSYRNRRYELILSDE
ncbi:nuclease-related domain-containing protein [Bacillus infantis]|uniref:nuclease-related domain-containing protein n=1 Tax=Bacillus infantis TaxID=324767 RepID=UPI003CEC721F